ncbi:MAG: hypothetical protein ABI548_13910 [Polyangiaceae bacterium]
MSDEIGASGDHGAASSGQSSYLDRLMRRESFAALWPLFAKGEKPAKEMTESFSALEHLRPLIREGEPLRVLHVGDGAHGRTAAMFSIKTSAENISIDPEINVAILDEWRTSYAIERFAWRKGRIQAVAAEFAQLPPMRTFVTFVHAHVNVDAVLALLKWDAAFTLACCYPTRQLSNSKRVHSSGSDQHVLSPGRSYQVLLP